MTFHGRHESGRLCVNVAYGRGLTIIIAHIRLLLQILLTRALYSMNKIDIVDHFLERLYANCYRWPELWKVCL